LLLSPYSQTVFRRLPLRLRRRGHGVNFGRVLEREVRQDVREPNTRREYGKQDEAGVRVELFPRGESPLQGNLCRAGRILRAAIRDVKRKNRAGRILHVTDPARFASQDFT
jgi:hypothetical protein